ncbi:MAG: hypothetical protein CJBNEKGG_03985 [Prosthecobacter sp.]|nr:hypothetical protein [Prosthecobacter sp.]
MSAPPDAYAPKRQSKIGHGHAPREHPNHEMADQAITVPHGWQTVYLQDIGELSRGKSKHRPRNDAKLYGGPHPFIQTGDIRESGGTIRKHSQTYSDLGLAQSRLWPAGTLCITIAANIGETGILSYPACFPDSVVGFHYDGDPVTVRFIELYFRIAKAELERLAPATAQKNINVEILSKLPVPLPPLPDQRRIVAEIEKQFTRLEAGVEALRRVQANLKRYRAAVLKAACEGRLVPTEAELCGSGVPLLDPDSIARPSSSKAGSKVSPNPKRQDAASTFESGQQLLARILSERRQNWQGRGKYKEPDSPEVDDLVTLPDGWTWATVDQITVNHDGRRVPLKSADRDKRSGQYPYYGASGIIDDIDDFLFDGEFLLIAEDGANLLSRSTPIAFKATGRFWVNNHAHIVQTLGGIPLAYLAVFLNGKDLSFSVTGSAQPKLTQAALNKIPVPLPPLAEQTRIVAEVERRLSVVEELEAVVTTNLQRATRLRQAVLQKAFTGELG